MECLCVFEHGEVRAVCIAHHRYFKRMLGEALKERADEEANRDCAVVERDGVCEAHAHRDC
jgi:hypothetical protein